MAEGRHWDETIRLACQAELRDGPVAIERLIWTSAETSHLQLEKIPVGTGEERDLGFLFCDMRNFTKMAEGQLNFDLAHILNRFFTALGDPVFMNNGIIYQYAGDEIIAIFGAGEDNPEKVCLDAIRAALGMLYAINRLNKWELKDFEVELRIGIGVHFGRAFIGNIGHYRHKQFAVVGDAMNITSRIQTKNKELGTELLISKDVLDQIEPDTVVIGKKSEVVLRGKQGSHTVFEVTGFQKGKGRLLLQSSIDALLKDEDRFASRFYERVFERAPEVQELFSTNMQAQGRMLTHMLRGIVYALSRPEYLRMGLKSLGKQHQDYKVEPEHYPVVKEALMETIEEALGEDYSREIGWAWKGALDHVIEMMTAGYEKNHRSIQKE